MNHKETERVRLDKWLWAARFFKTRALSAEAIDKGRVTINGQLAKASREPQPGQTIEFRQGNELRTVVVKGLSAVRGPATEAQRLYEETPESLARRLAAAEQRRMAPEPALSQPMGRPTKRDRRTLKDWGDRWSASLDDPDE
jgi:ribosome-associated heat shock protein Hsp15